MPRGREPRPLRPTLCFPVQLRALLYRLREGADHVGRLCGCGRGTEEGAGLVSLMISEIRGNRGAFDVEDPGVHDLTVNLHHYFIILPIDHVICRGVDTGVRRAFRVEAINALPRLHRSLIISTPVCQHALRFPQFNSPKVFIGSVGLCPSPHLWRLIHKTRESREKPHRPNMDSTEIARTLYISCLI